MAFRTQHREDDFIDRQISVFAETRFSLTCASPSTKATELPVAHSIE